MEVTFINPGVDAMLQSIMAFQSEDECAFWPEPLYYFYPQLDKTHAAGLPFPARKDYIERTLRRVYSEQEKVIEGKTAAYSRHWAMCKGQIKTALSGAFAIYFATLFNDLRCNVSPNPSEPRFLKERRFDIFYLNIEFNAPGVPQILELTYVGEYAIILSTKQWFFRFTSISDYGPLAQLVRASGS